jgi:hypothetical protein
MTNQSRTHAPIAPPPRAVPSVALAQRRANYCARTV